MKNIKKTMCHLALKGEVCDRHSFLQKLSVFEASRTSFLKFGCSGMQRPKGRGFHSIPDIKKVILYAGILIFFLIPYVNAAADFDVTTFSCTPSEVAINDVFSCTAQIKNNGDVAGSVNELRLYPDVNAWLEQSNYLQNSGTSVSPGQNTEVTFSSMRATKSGNNGFARITLDNEDDTYVSDNNIKENVVDVSVTTTNSATSKASGQTFTTTPEVTAGGIIDVTLTFTVDSGGCTINNQNSQKSTTNLNHQQKWTPSAWTVTMGTSGNCQFTLTAAATGDGGVASKSVSISNTVTCSNCVTSSGSSSKGGGGGGAGGKEAKTTFSAGKLTTSVQQELKKDESLGFTFGKEDHVLSVINLTETTAIITIESTKKTLTFTVGEEKSVDITDDRKNDITIRLKSINIITKKALFIITPLYIPEDSESSEKDSEESTGIIGEEAGEKSRDETAGKGTGSKSLIIIIVSVLAVIIIAGIIYFFWKKGKEKIFQRSVRVKSFKN